MSPRGSWASNTICPWALNSVRLGKPPQPTIQPPPGSACALPQQNDSSEGVRTYWAASVAVLALGSSLTSSPREGGLTGGLPSSSYRLIWPLGSHRALC